ncbi:MAG: hypothetical protein VXX31_12955 [Planctomycetota bacterium]|nr:hypothetical protein [Planctomycetota bacterium]
MKENRRFCQGGNVMGRYGGAIVLLIGLVGFILTIVYETNRVIESYPFYGAWTYSVSMTLLSTIRNLLFALGFIVAGVTLMALAAK